MATIETATTQDYRLGFDSQEQETSVDQLALSGSLPAWLTGTLVRTGPAKFEVGDQRFNLTVVGNVGDLGQRPASAFTHLFRGFFGAGVV